MGYKYANRIRRGLAVAAVVFVFFTGPALSAGPAAPGAFKIGAVVSFTGTYGIFGEEIRKGVEFAVAERGGKVLGGPIQITWADDETRPQLAVQKANHLLDEGVHLLLGAVSSASTIAIMDVAKRHMVPHLVTASADDKITLPLPNGSRYTFRTSNSFGMEMRMARAAGAAARRRAGCRVP